MKNTKAPPLNLTHVLVYDMPHIFDQTRIRLQFSNCAFPPRRAWEHFLVVDRNLARALHSYTTLGVAVPFA